MRVLVAGVGDVLLGDDGFGVEVARRVAGGPVPAGVRVAEFGIGGVPLAYELLGGYDALILIDTVERGGDPGTVYVIESNGSEGEAAPMDGYDMSPEAVLAVLQTLGEDLSRVVVVGCEPADIGEGVGLSSPVERAVDDAVRIVRELLDEPPRETR